MLTTSHLFLKMDKRPSQEGIPCPKVIVKTNILLYKIPTLLKYFMTPYLYCHEPLLKCITHVICAVLRSWLSEQRHVPWCPTLMADQPSGVEHTYKTEFLCTQLYLPDTVNSIYWEFIHVQCKGNCWSCNKASILCDTSCTKRKYRNFVTPPQYTWDTWREENILSKFQVLNISGLKVKVFKKYNRFVIKKMWHVTRDTWHMTHGKGEHSPKISLP